MTKEFKEGDRVNIVGGGWDKSTGTVSHYNGQLCYSNRVDKYYNVRVDGYDYYCGEHDRHTVAAVYLELIRDPVKEAIAELEKHGKVTFTPFKEVEVHTDGTLPSTTAPTAFMLSTKA